MEGAVTAAVIANGAADGAAVVPARETQVFTAPEIMCGGCLKTIESTLADTPGVFNARANLSARRVTVTFDPAVTSPEIVIAATRSTPPASAN